MKTKTYEQLDKGEFKKYIEQIVDHMYIQNSSREQITTIISEMSEKWGIKKPILRKIASIHYKQNKENFQDENNELATLLKILE